MNRIGWTATLATVALVLASCRPTGLEPSGGVPASRLPSEVETPGPGDEPELAGVSAPTSNQAAEEGPHAPSLIDYTPKTSEGRVLVAIGKAVTNSIRGDSD